MKVINISVVLFCILSGVVNASDVTIGENGINSASLSLPNGDPLDGEGIVIGQAEQFRPGDPKMSNGAAFDTMASLFNTQVDPLGVYFMKFDDTQNPTTITSFLPTVNGTVIPGDPPIQIEISEHAVQVAGVMISSDTGTPSTAGVSPEAILFSIGHTGSSSQKADAVATQFIATANLGDVRAVNISFGQFLDVGQTTDGNSLITQFIDWSHRDITSCMWWVAHNYFRAETRATTLCLQTILMESQ